MLLADSSIRGRMLLPEGDIKRLVIRPFAEPNSVPGTISFGLTSCGYDLRLGDKFLVFSNMFGSVVDPLTFREEVSKRRANSQNIDFKGDKCVIPPNSFVLAESVEYLEIPEDCLGLVIGKSTYARCAINLNCTPLEPGWKGIVTLEIANMSPLPAVVHAGMGIGQVMFFQSDVPCDMPYNKKKNARYQNQIGLTPPSVN